MQSGAGIDASGKTGTAAPRATPPMRHAHAGIVGQAHDHERVRRVGAGKLILILIGDGIHNLTDGARIAAAFLTDFQLGAVTMTSCRSCTASACSNWRGNRNSYGSCRAAGTSRRSATKVTAIVLSPG